jgi:hypothetical protein
VTAKEREKIRLEFLTHTLDTRGRFGCAEERIWPCMIGMIEKGGMTDDKLKKYIDNSINIQSQNDYSTTQLNVMGFRCDVLRAQFRPDKISER